MIEVSLPARINIVGSPTDAVEGAYATVSAAVEIYGGARIQPGDGLTFRRADGSERTYAGGYIEQTQGFAIEEAAVNALLRHCPELQSKLPACGFEVATWTDVPSSSGIAGSSVLLLAVLAALRAHYGLDPVAMNDYVLAEIAQRAEEHDMGVVCGFADRYVPLFGDIFSFWFKSNARNHELIKQHARNGGFGRKATRGDWLFVIGVLVALVAIVLTGLAVTAYVIAQIVQYIGR